MRDKFRSLFACLMTGLLLALSAALPSGTQAAENGPVYVIPVVNEIETGLSVSLHRAFDEAEQRAALAIVLDIDTLGGRIDAALEIGEQIRSSKVPVIAYVRGKAISAGAYIALNAKHIAMSPGSTIGAAEARTASGEETDPKINAVWRSEMVAAAEATGRNTQIAAGMVDRNLEIPGLKVKGELLSLTAQEAVKQKIADGTFQSLNDVLAHYGYQGADVFEYQPSVSEKIARFVTKPAVIPILLIIGLLGLTVELLIPGHLFPGLVGAASLGLYFFGHMVAGFAGWESVILFVVGLILMIAEIFVTGFGIIGGLGVLALGAGVVMAAYDTTYGLKAMLLAIIIAVIAGIVIFKYFGHLGMWNRLILSDRQEKAAGYVPTRNYRHMMYQIGRTITPLRPSGTAVFHGQRFDVVSEGAFIPVDTEVQIVLVEGTRIVVRETDKRENKVIPLQSEE
jgi:membrane-bound serine protease (ClpP class)